MSFLLPLVAMFPFWQASVVANNLPADRYKELRSQTLAHANVLSGPRIRNPHISTSGMSREVISGLAEQRAYVEAHGGRMLTFSSRASNPVRGTSEDPSLAAIDPVSTASAQQPAVHLTASKGDCTPGIRRVNGRAAGAIFTPAEPDNYYILEGCGFGVRRGNAWLQPRPYAASTAQRSLIVPLQSSADSWTDTKIELILNSALTGFPDFAADLIVQLADGQQLRLTGCFFVASRGEPQLLTTIPASWVALEATSTASHSIQQLEYVSPPVANEELPSGAVGSSAFIVRSDLQSFRSGRDNFDFSQLAPGWVVESVQLIRFVSTCPGEDRPSESSGNWTASWTARGFSIAWATQTCTSRIPPVFNFALNYSQYSAKVWVVGPAGTPPLRRGF